MIILLWLHVKATTAQMGCKFDLQENSFTLTYDLTPIAGSTFISNDTTATYHYEASICQNLKTDCESIFTGTIENGAIYLKVQRESDDVCWGFLANWTEYSYQRLNYTLADVPLVTDGITLTFHNGDRCSAIGHPFKAMQVFYNLICDPNVETGELSGMISEYDRCTHVVNLRTKHACGYFDPKLNLTSLGYQADDKKCDSKSCSFTCDEEKYLVHDGLHLELKGLKSYWVENRTIPRILYGSSDRVLNLSLARYRNDNPSLSDWTVSFYSGQQLFQQSANLSQFALTAENLQVFVKPCESTKSCPAWLGMQGSSSKCNRTDGTPCSFECDDTTYYCSTEDGPDQGFVACDVKTGSWALATEKINGHPCNCTRLQFLCQTPGVHKPSGEHIEFASSAEEKFSSNSFQIIQGCNKVQYVYSSANYIDEVVTWNDNFMSTGDERCVMQCKEGEEILNSCAFRNYTCQAQHETDSKYGRALWTWAPDGCVPECGSNDAKKSKKGQVIFITAISLGVVCLLSGCLLYLYCQLHKPTESEYGILNN